MTIQDLINLVGQYPFIMFVWFVTIPVLSYLFGRLHDQNGGAKAPWKYIYSVMIYLVCLPGILAAVLTAYSLFFIRENLLNANLLVYFLPIISMAVSLFLIRKSVDFDDIPGFDRISGLMIVIAITFVLVLAIEKTRIWLFFGGSITRLIILVGGLLALLKWGAYMLFRKKDEPGRKRPSIPLD
ncbi:MAG: hypothetical protein A2161_18715 [Candidatus Schekmanbacteria bacterium RBG_13_48_7]|uniref:Uncharacterized protein n=1 Tax=Candidatus Schekmanbacteria bacterium RBG_13_48_7 TaxID=1817878 RepID=A0A1F7S222_9BACT|nr:MAG: hypothetical protein A2161_18715 [Candidatus Schekmanbacteria bacterium RBG_13_48_7]